MTWNDARQPSVRGFRTEGIVESVTGTDLEVELVATCAVSVQQPGDITVPGRKLLDIVRVVSIAAPDRLTRAFRYDHCRS